MDDPTGRILAAKTPEEVRSIASELAESAAKIEVELSATKRARELLLNTVAHDLRNPLNTFAMSVGLLKDDLERQDFDPARALALVKRMERSTAKMQLLVEDLLEASRVEARAIELNARVESAFAIAERACQAAQRLGEERHIRIALAESDKDVRVSLDPERTAHALVKLVSYVLKSTAEGGSIAIGVTRREREVLFAVRGVPPPTAPVAAPLDAGRGGLALLIGRGLLEAQGCNVGIETDLVAITLPTAD